MQGLPQKAKIIFQKWSRLEIHEGALHCQKPNEPRQLILLSKLKPLVYHDLHPEMGHVGTDRTTKLIK